MSKNLVKLWSVGLYHPVLHIGRLRGKVAVWLSGNIVGRINEVTLRRAGLVLRWVTVRGYTI